MAVTTIVTQSASQANLPFTASNVTVNGIQGPYVEGATVTYGSPLTISDGIGYLIPANLNYLYWLSDNLDCTVEFHDTTAGGGSVINTWYLTAGSSQQWYQGTNPLGTTTCKSIVITSLATIGAVWNGASWIGGVAAGSIVTTAMHARTSLTG
jgi:hypothetical protein